ncbi:mechanosensitive ion channel family protein [Nitrospina gracilis]|uniref:mechanosensitive ion channel family protein n=1 Tax=Nitrospina gracilis TaxID=35801 RepID=UPI001F2C29AA|nr:mechanosensitive ion channel family protein [Nitrospina gracilis]MCF8720120.1 MscS family membrane protein [Nitrospina gracilis Nb-211]
MDFESIVHYITEDHSYILQAFLVVFVTLLVDYFQKRAFDRLQKRAETSASIWDEALIDAVRKPLRLAIWTIGVYTASEVIEEAISSVVFEMMGPARDTLIIASITWFIVRLIKNGEEVFLKKEGTTLDRTTADAIAKLLKLSVVITAFLVVLQTLGFSISGVLAFGGIGGIAVGFAARDLLANFFGGLMIYLDRPFVVGEWVRSPDREIEGIVEDIGWRLTRIRTFDKRPLYVPNAVFASISVENPSRMENRRIYETIGIRYDDISKMGTIVEKVKSMLANHPEIDTNKTLIVNFNKFAASSLDFFIYTFTKTTVWERYHEIKQDVLLKVIDIIEKEGAEVAFPTSTIHLANGWNTQAPEPQAPAKDYQ